MSVTYLPEFVLDQIRRYICSRPFLPGHVDHPVYSMELCQPNFDYEIVEEQEWRYFLNTTKLFNLLKRKTCYFTLWDTFAIRYTADQQFRDRVNGLVNDPNKQLTIIVTAETAGINKLDYYHWNNCHVLIIARLKESLDFASLNMIHSLQIENCSELLNVQSLPNLVKLCVDSCEALSYVADLPNLRELYAMDCDELTEVKNLPELRILSVTGCLHLSLDETFLRNFPNLVAGWFPYSMIDLNWPIELLSLALTSLPVESFYSICNVKQLYLFRCENVQEIGNLLNLEYLYLYGCNELSKIDFRSLPILTTVTFAKCNKLETLIIEEGVGLSNQKIALMKKVVIWNCKALKSIHIRRNLLRLIIGCPSSSTPKRNTFASIASKFSCLTRQIDESLVLSIYQPYLTPRLIFYNKKVIVKIQRC